MRIINNNIEKIPVKVYKTKQEASIAVANEIADLISRKNAEGKKTVLGLATGSSPIKIYEELIRIHKEEGLSFKNVITFNLDEYYPMTKEDINSYHYFMHHHLFDHIDIDKNNVHIPDGTLEKDDINKFCKDYEYAIEENGGLDLQLLGIGRTGHVGFNEPGSQFFSKTRLIELHSLTKKDAAPAFNGYENVPNYAITMGIGTIMKAKRIILVAWGDKKSDILKSTVEGEASDMVPATLLRNHYNVQFFIDEEASAQLSRSKTPWLFHECEWNKKLVLNAVVWLCNQVNKPILKLTDQDYMDNGLTDLLHLYKSSYDLNIKAFNSIQHTITGWPGGKPDADDSQRPERAKPYPKRVVVFSPHPDDDVISMGGTIARLVKQNHEIHIVYQTSGNNAVWDDDLIKYLNFISLSKDNLDITDKTNETINNLLDGSDKVKKNKTVLELKGIIRQCEAISSCRFMGIKEENIHFIKMPFYENKEAEEHKLSKDDIKLITDLLNDIKPHQIYAAGDLNDPHGTHELCYEAIKESLNEIRKDKASSEWLNDCYMWLYKGAWDEWQINEADMAVPISPDEVTAKRKAIFKHQTQKDVMPFPGSDSREFWQRAEERNHKTAEMYNKIGFAEYQAMELFVKQDY